jgi:hypothetical protein
VNIKGPPDRFGTLPDGGQPEVPRGGCSWDEAPSVVADGEFIAIRADLKRYIDVGGASMPCHICERFLRDPVQRDLNIRGKRVLFFDGHCHLDPSSGHDRFSELLQKLLQLGFRQRRRAELKQERAHLG